jgi:hypothetical protein
MDLDSFYDTARTKSFINHLPDAAIQQGIPEVLESYPWHFVNLDQFKALIRQSKKSSLRLLSDDYARYGVPFDADPLDQYVAASMKRWNRDLYDSLKGYTKLPYVGRAYHQLLKYAKPLKTSVDIHSDERTARCYYQALDDVRQLFKGRKFSTLPLNDMMQQIPMNTAAGMPYRSKKQDAAEECFSRTVRNYNDLISGRKIQQQPCMLALRGHLSPIDQIKTRPVWINSFDHLTLENMMFRKIYDFAFNDADFQELLLTGPNTISRLRNYLHTPSNLAFVNLDFSAWDTWPCRFAGRDLFKIFEEVVDFKDGERQVFKFVEKQFLESTMVLPDGSCIRKSSGTCTGSLLTALFNSLLNYLVLRTSLRVMDVHLCVQKMKILGDDASFFCAADGITRLVETLSTTLFNLFGLTLNPQKCVIAGPFAPVEDRVFIGYSLRGNQLYRDERKFFMSVLYTEHAVKDLRTSFSRVVSYLLLGGIFHSDFCGFVQQYLGHFERHLSSESNLLDENVFRVGNLRVFTHVFQMSLEEIIGTGLTLESFRNFDFMSLPYSFTLGYKAS